ncbi:hypothetical protein HYY72_03430 [Candidatus Woesearchaeota archaeon]|nr:hypothetical protein [Candidatus Woesearchaeota archaeon]
MQKMTGYINLQINRIMKLILFQFRQSIPHIRAFLSKYLLAITLSITFTLAALALSKYFILALLLLAHAASCFLLKTLKRNHIGIELTTLITVLSGVAYGAKAGAIIGAAAMSIDYAFSMRLSYFSIITIPSFALVGILAGTFSRVNIFTLGIMLTIFYSIFTGIFILGFMGGHPDKCLRFGITSLGFNALLFSAIAPALLSMMA